MHNIELIRGDITNASVDAIVNAADPALLGGGGVDGAIHRAAGPALLQACKQIEAVNNVRCPTGEARITIAGDLKARYVIHTVGPRYAIDPNPAALLARAYRSAFRLALDNHCKILAVPAISCGVYGYPLAAAAEIAIGTSADSAFKGLSIHFYLFGDESFAAFSAALARHKNAQTR